MRALTFIALLLLVIGCAGPRQDSTSGGTETTRSAAAAPVYVDVRTPEEYASGHVVGAINIPHDQMATRWKELEAYRDTPMVLYCRSGRRSAIAEEVLKENGFTKTTNGGGIEDLKANGIPTE